jgi:predicted N-acetyltransferase YhbS
MAAYFGVRQTDYYPKFGFVPVAEYMLEWPDSI